MKWTSLCIFLIVGLVAATENTKNETEIFTKTPDELWQHYKDQYDKKYNTPEEEARRKEIVLEKYRKLKEQLALRNSSQIIHTINISKYSDLSHKEFMEQMFGPDKNKNTKYLKFNDFIPVSISTRISFNNVLFTTIILILFLTKY